MENMTDVFISFGLIILSITSACILKFSKSDFVAVNRKILEIIFIYIPLAAALLILLYFSADTLYDFLYVCFVISILVYLGKVFKKREGTNYKFQHMYYLLSYTIMFFIAKEINKHLIIPISYMWLVNFAIINFVYVMKDGNKSDRKGLLSFSTNLIGIVLMVVLINILSEPFDGFSKQEHIVKAYLLEKEGYDKSEIKELRRLTSPRGKGEKRVFVSIKREENKAFIYHYKAGKVVNIEKLNYPIPKAKCMI